MYKHQKEASTFCEHTPSSSFNIFYTVVYNIKETEITTLSVAVGNFQITLVKQIIILWSTCYTVHIVNTTINFIMEIVLVETLKNILLLSKCFQEHDIPLTLTALYILGHVNNGRLTFSYKTCEINSTDSI